MSWNQSQAPARNQGTKRPAGGVLRLALLVAAACFAVGAGVWWMTGRTGRAVATDAGKHTDAGRKLKHAAHGVKKSGRDAVRDAMPKNLPRRAKKHQHRDKPVDLYAHLPAKERALAESVQKALDSDDLTSTVKAAEAALASKNAEVRQNAVEALGWFGVEALPELTGCMADPDEDVRNAAANAWELAVQQLEKAGDQFNVVMAAFGSLTDEDQLTMLNGIVRGAALELIDGADDDATSSNNRLDVVQKLVDVIEGDNPKSATAAKEVYEDITGNEWRSFEEAERYLADPENYDPDEAPQTVEVMPPAESTSGEQAETATDETAP